MKKNKILLIITIIYFMMPVLVYAGRIRFNYPTKKADRVYEFTLTAEDISAINYVTGDLYTPNASITNITMMSDWKNATGKNNHFYFYHDGERTGSYTIAIFEITIKGDSYYKVLDFNFGLNKCQTDSYKNYFGENGNLVSKETYTKTCLVSKDATLKSLTISNGTISPSFDPQLELYSATVENNVQSVVFNAVPNSNKATVYDTVCSLKQGLNLCKVTVRAEAGNTKTYTIAITKKSAPSNPQAGGSTGTGSGSQTPGGSSGTESGSQKPGNTPETESGSQKPGSSSGTGNVTQYLSNDPSIKNLIVHGGSLMGTFQSHIKEYNVKVDKNADNVYFSFAFNSNDQEFTSGKCSTLADICNLTVTAEDGKTKTTYKFHLINENVVSNKTVVSSSTNKNTSSTSSSTSKNNVTSNNLNVGTSKPQTENNASSNTTNENFVQPETSNNSNNTVEENKTQNTVTNENNTENETSENIEKEENKYSLKYIAIFVAGFVIIGCLLININRARKRKKSQKKK